MEARPTCFSMLFANYFQDLENDPRCNFDESESIFSRNDLTASRFMKNWSHGALIMGPKGAHDDDDDDDVDDNL